MEKRDLLQEILSVIHRIAQIDTISPDTMLDEAGLTSMNVVELLIELETRFNVTLPDEAFLAAKTPREIWALLSALPDGAMVGAHVGELVLA